MHCVARIDGVDHFEGVAVDDRHLARVTQRDRHKVFPVAAVLRRAGPSFGRHQHLPGLTHLFERHLRRRGRLVLQEFRHHLGLRLGQHPLLAPVGHPARGAVEDDRSQRNRALGRGLVRRQRGTGRAVTQRAVAARAAVEEDLARAGELLLRERNRGRGDGSPRRCGARRLLRNCRQGFHLLGQPGQVLDHRGKLLVREGLGQCGGHQSFLARSARATFGDVRVGVNDCFAHVVHHGFCRAGVRRAVERCLGCFAHSGQVRADRPSGVRHPWDDVARAAAALLECCSEHLRL